MNHIKNLKKLKLKKYQDSLDYVIHNFEEMEADIEQLDNIIIAQRVAMNDLPAGCDTFVCVDCGMARKKQNEKRTQKTKTKIKKKKR